MSKQNPQEKDNLVFEKNYISLYQISIAVWKNKLIIIILMIFSVIYSSYVLRNSTFEFEVKLDVIPLNEGSSMGNSSIQALNQILGIERGGTKSQLGLYRSLINSHSIAKILSNDIEFVKNLAGDSWDNKSQSIKSSKIGFTTKIKNTIKIVLGVPVFKQNLSNQKFVLSHIRKIQFRPAAAGMTEVYIQTDKTDRGALILLKAHHATENFLKTRQKMKTIKNINFIDSKLAQPQKSEHKASLIKMLSDQQKSLMISSSDMPYAVETFSELPTVSEYPVAPNSKLILIVNLLISIAISFILISLKEFLNLRKSKND